jgi:hypothetical protein
MNFLTKPLQSAALASLMVSTAGRRADGHAMRMFEMDKDESLRSNISWPIYQPGPKPADPVNHAIRLAVRKVVGARPREDLAGIEVLRKGLLDWRPSKKLSEAVSIDLEVEVNKALSNNDFTTALSLYGYRNVLPLHGGERFCDSLADIVHMSYFGYSRNGPLPRQPHQGRIVYDEHYKHGYGFRVDGKSVVEAKPRYEVLHARASKPMYDPKSSTFGSFTGLNAPPTFGKRAMEELQAQKLFWGTITKGRTEVPDFLFPCGSIGDIRLKEE